jgi:hypothetical protein
MATLVPYPAFGEMRVSPCVDDVVMRSNGRIVVAAPYFTYSSDRVLRDWKLLKVVCEPEADRVTGRLRIVPSVQLMVFTKYLGVQPAKLAQESSDICKPFPWQEMSGHEIPLLADLVNQRQEMDHKENTESEKYWETVKHAVLQATERRSGAGVDMGEAAPNTRDIGSRIVFRSGADLQSDEYFDEVPAGPLLRGMFDEQRMTSMFGGRVVVTGQSYRETGDWHDTPMGRMPIRLYRSTTCEA